MKSPTQQRLEKIQRIADLIIQSAEHTASAFDESLSITERGEHALKAIMINEVELPLVMQTPIQVVEYPKGGSVHESGSEIVKNKDGYFLPICDADKMPYVTLLRTGEVDGHGDVIMPGAFGKAPVVTIRKHYTAEQTKEILDRIKNQHIPWSAGMAENPVKIEEIKPITEYTPDPERVAWDLYIRQMKD